jgi:hypothetical protein
MKDKGVALSNLGKQAPFANLTEEEEARVLALTAEIKNIFDNSIRQQKAEAS